MVKVCSACMGRGTVEHSRYSHTDGVATMDVMVNCRTCDGTGIAEVDWYRAGRREMLQELFANIHDYDSPYLVPEFFNRKQFAMILEKKLEAEDDECV